MCSPAAPINPKRRENKNGKNEITNPRNTNYRKEKEIQRDERRQKQKLRLLLLLHEIIGGSVIDSTRN